MPRGGGRVDDSESRSRVKVQARSRGGHLTARKEGRGVPFGQLPVMVQLVVAPLASLKL